MRLQFTTLHIRMILLSYILTLGTLKFKNYYYYYYFTVNISIGFPKHLPFLAFLSFSCISSFLLAIICPSFRRSCLLVFFSVDLLVMISLSFWLYEKCFYFIFIHKEYFNWK